MEKLDEQLEGFLAPRLLLEMLKFQVGQNIICPKCKRVMDWHRAVCLDVTRVDNEALVYTQVFCTQCFDRMCRVTDAAVSATLGYAVKLKVVDGRDWDAEELYDPAHPVVGAPVTFLAAKRDEPHGRQVIGNMVDLGLKDWDRRFAVYQSNLLWFVCELQTGYSVARGASQADAMHSAWHRLREAGKDAFLANAAKVVVLNPGL